MASVTSVGICLGALTFFGAAGAVACPTSTDVRERFLGVDGEGTAVFFREGFDEREDAFVAFAKNGNEVARLGQVWESADRRPWKPAGGDYFTGYSKEADAKDLEHRIRKTKKLTLPAKRKLRHVQSDNACGSIEIETSTGWVRVAESNASSAEFSGVCPKYRVLEAFDAKASSVIVVHLAYFLGNRTQSQRPNELWEDVDRFLLLPKARVRAAELALEGERERLQGDPDVALSKLTRAVASAPELMQARASLVRLLLAHPQRSKKLHSLLVATVGSYRPIGTPPPAPLWEKAVALTFPGAADPDADEVVPPWSSYEGQELKLLGDSF